jgi:hypothetical protein
VAGRADGLERLHEVRQLLLDHRIAGSALARRLLEQPHRLASELWLIESIEEAGDVVVDPPRPDIAGAVEMTDGRTDAR